MKMTQDEIRNLIVTDYIANEDLSINRQITDNLKILKDCGKASVFKEKGDPFYNTFSKHRIYAKYMCDANQSIKDYFDYDSVYNDDEESFVQIKGDNEYLKYRGYILPTGTYYAQLDDGENFAILIVEETSRNDDDYLYQPFNSSLYFIGPKHIKYARKMKNKLKKLNISEKEQKHEVVMKFANGRRMFKTDTFKPFEKVIFDGKEDILSYVDNWVNSLPNYEKYGITPKLSFLLHGEPGTGKSTFAKALARYLDIETVCIIDSNCLMDGSASGMYNKAVILIDDIDCIGSSRKDKNADKESKELIGTLLEFLDTPPTFNFKGNDGKFYKVSIVVSTTNYYNKLDDAVKRFGRFDKTIEMKNFKLPEIEKMCTLYDIKASDIIDESKINNPKFVMSPAELQAKCIEKVNSKLKKMEVKTNEQKEKAHKGSKKKHKGSKKWKASHKR